MTNSAHSAFSAVIQNIKEIHQMTKPLWDKGLPVSDWVTRFTVGNDPQWDTMLLPYDLRGTEAHVWGLAQIGILTNDEHRQIAAVLDELEKKWESGDLVVEVADEDCHTVIERALTERLGETGKKIHAGRSRNDQVLVALRLWLRDAVKAVVTEEKAVVDALLDQAEAHSDVLMPGYTHLQRAMPSTVGLWAASFAEVLLGDLEALVADAEAVDVSPWGSAAGYGVPFLELPRDAVAERLGFQGDQRHVGAVQLSRGKGEARIVHGLVQTAATINRLASDLVLFSTNEFGFVSLPVEHTTGSSIMPQKRNPDVLELARGTYHRLTSELNLLLSLPANLPSGYHRDLQLTKEAAMRSTIIARDLLTAVSQILPGLEWNEERLTNALSTDLFATAEAMRRVREGSPFREAYREVAADLSSIEVPASDEVLAAYVTSGTPGRLDTEALRRRAAAFGDLTG